VSDDAGRIVAAGARGHDKSRRPIFSAAIGAMGTPAFADGFAPLQRVGFDTVTRSDNPTLAKMPARPTRLDFFRPRLHPRGVNHLPRSASLVAAMHPIAQRPPVRPADLRCFRPRAPVNRCRNR